MYAPKYKNMYGAGVAFFTFFKNVKNLVRQDAQRFVRQDAQMLVGQVCKFSSARCANFSGASV